MACSEAFTHKLILKRHLTTAHKLDLTLEQIGGQLLVTDTQEIERLKSVRKVSENKAAKVPIVTPKAPIETPKASGAPVPLVSRSSIESRSSH